MGRSVPLKIIYTHLLHYLWCHLLAAVKYRVGVYVGEREKAIVLLVVKQQGGKVV